MDQYLATLLGFGADYAYRQLADQVARSFRNDQIDRQPQIWSRGSNG